MSSLASSWSWLASGELLLSLRWDSVSTASNAVVMPLLSLPAEEVSPPGAMPLLERVAGNNVNGGSSSQRYPCLCSQWSRGLVSLVIGHA